MVTERRVVIFEANKNFHESGECRKINTPEEMENVNRQQTVVKPKPERIRVRKLRTQDNLVGGHSK